jgi:guanosine-3',5'-bis(diphosphate) 3'-pyrophosphohydrolase
MKLEEIKMLLKALTFAADKHRFQKRKDTEGTPYINHPIQVALMLADVGEETNEDLLVAAILHDTIEDTKTTSEEIAENFGSAVLNLVLEVTDDKNLPKEERKKRQVLNASKKSESARKLKLADKICNVADILHHPPGNWTSERKLQYLGWAEQVLEGLHGTNLKLENKLKALISEGRVIFGIEETRELVR